MPSSGREYRILLRLGLPVLVTQLGIIVVSFADTMMVGAYGTAELGASAFVNSIFLVSIVALIGFANGMTPLIGALFGKNKERLGGITWRAGLILNVLAALAVTALMTAVYFFLPLFGQPEELLPVIRPYYLTCLTTFLPAAVFNCCQQTSNGINDTAMPMWIMIGGNLLNILGNYALIFGKLGCPELGLLGAGISTAAARYAMAAGILACMLTRRRFSTLRNGLQTRPRRKVYAKVWVTSYPVMIQSAMECSLWALGAVVCGWFGTYQLASYQIVNILGQIGFMVYLSCGVAVSIRVANHTGELDIKGVRRTASDGLHIMMVLATLSSAVLLIFAKPLLYLFTPDPAVIEEALPLVLPLVFYQYFDAFQLNFSNALRGTADVKPLLTVSVVNYLFVGVVAIFIFAVGLDLGNVGVYYSFALTLFSAGIMLFYYFKRAVRRLEKTLF